MIGIPTYLHNQNKNSTFQILLSTVSYDTLDSCIQSICNFVGIFLNY